MGSSNIRDILTSFSPSLDFFAISSGDGRIKIWDTLKGQIQTEFADIISNDGTDLFSKPQRGHLSVDYTCMKWLSLERKKKRKIGSSLLILGTGGGDVMALDVSAGQLKWRISDCHPGGVNAVSFSAIGLSVYTAGADGMVCEIDSLTGNLSGKFRASTKAISSLSVSSDGRTVATASAQLRIFNCTDRKKIQKFSGHPGAVRCMIFTDDDKYILSSAVGERYIAVWKLDGSKKRSASCVLAMEHPAVFLDSRCMGNGVDDEGLCVLAISEIGVCYFWFGHNIEELHKSKPTKISLSSENLNYKGPLPTIFGAKLQGIAKPSSGHMFLSYGLPVKPSFHKILVPYGTDIKLSGSQDGVLLPIKQSRIKSKKGVDIQIGVTALDRANAEDALLPIPKIFESQGKKSRRPEASDISDETMLDLADVRNQTRSLGSEGFDELEGDTVCIEERLRALGILTSEDEITSDSIPNSTKFMGIDIEANLPEKKMRAAVSSMASRDAYKLLGILLAMWKSRSNSGIYVLPWIYSILVNHSHYVKAKEPETQMLNSLHKITKSRGVAVQPLLQLSGRLQLVMAQIGRAYQNKTQISSPNHQMDESESEDEDVDEILYGEEEDEESQISHDDDE